jgi:hypothetical protein
MPLLPLGRLKDMRRKMEAAESLAARVDILEALVYLGRGKERPGLAIELMLSGQGLSEQALQLQAILVAAGKATSKIGNLSDIPQAAVGRVLEVRAAGLAESVEHPEMSLGGIRLRSEDLGESTREVTGLHAGNKRTVHSLMTINCTGQKNIHLLSYPQCH